MRNSERNIANWVGESESLASLRVNRNKILEESDIAELQTILTTGIRQGYGEKAVALDITQVEHLSSNALPLVIEAKRELEKQKKKFALVGASPQISDVLRVTRLSTFFECYHTMQEAKEKYALAQK